MVSRQQLLLMYFIQSLYFSVLLTDARRLLFNYYTYILNIRTGTFLISLVNSDICFPLEMYILVGVP